jgi:hypothetical protein
MYVVFHKDFPHQDRRYFKSEAGAKRSATCSNRNAGKRVYEVLNETFFALKHPVKTKVVKSLMTGAAVEIPEDTPWCCNPASESYWSN